MEEKQEIDEKIEVKQEEKNTNENKKGSWWQALKFLLFSISAGAIQIGTFSIMHEWIGWDNWWACHLISLSLSVIWNFTFNRKFTFKSSNNVPFAMLLVLLYYAAFTPASIFGGQALKDIGWNGTLVEALMMVINFVTEFIWQKFVVFNPKVVPEKKIKS